MVRSPILFRDAVVVAMYISSFVAPQRLAVADEVSRWNEIATASAFRSGLSNIPPIEARVYAITQAAVHDALNAIDRRFESYAFKEWQNCGASADAAVATASYRVLSDQFGQLTAIGLPSQEAALRQAYTAALDRLPAGQRKEEGIAIGTSAAAAILALRADDGWNNQPVQDFHYPQGTKPGEYRFTPPFTFALLPQWGTVRPFILHDSHQFWPPPPYHLKSARYAADVNEIKSLGGDGVITPSARTPEQTQVARFWVESSPLQWNRIARIVSEGARLDSWQKARLLALLNFALADGYISSFDAKYYYKYWRPITAIREADHDGNPLTQGDPTWTPLVDTPPIPDYDSAHSVEGAAAAEVMRQVMRTDKIPFHTCSTTMPAGQNCGESAVVYRSYSRLSQASEENGISRILVGFHFRNAVMQGFEHGRKIGRRAANRYLRPADRWGFETDQAVQAEIPTDQ